MNKHLESFTIKGVPKGDSLHHRVFGNIGRTAVVLLNFNLPVNLPYNDKSDFSFINVFTRHGCCR